LKLFIPAFWTVVIVRLALCLLPFRILRSWAAGISPHPRPLPVESLVWSVKAGARRVPMATCLTQALALQRLLGRAGIASTLEIGVSKERSEFAAHAWLTHEGRVLIGGETRSYVPLAAWEDSK
jgi:hypothetical protein